MAEHNTRRELRPGELIAGGLALAVALVVIVPTILRARQAIHDMEYGKQPNLSQISQWTDVEFPSSTKLVHSRYWVMGMGRDMRVLVQMDRAQVKGFLEKNFDKECMTRYDEHEFPVAKRQKIIGQLFHPPVKPLEWWHPESVKRFVVADGSLCDMVIGLDDPKHADVWMFETH